MVDIVTITSKATVDFIDKILPVTKASRHVGTSRPRAGSRRQGPYQGRPGVRRCVDDGPSWRGACFVTRDQILRAQPLPITPRSAVGAGDSFLAALIWRRASGADLAQSFRPAVAAGAVALLNTGRHRSVPPGRTSRVLPAKRFSNAPD